MRKTNVNNEVARISLLFKVALLFLVNDSHNVENDVSKLKFENRGANTSNVDIFSYPDLFTNLFTCLLRIFRSSVISSFFCASPSFCLHSSAKQRTPLEVRGWCVDFFEEVDFLLSGLFVAG